MKRRLVFLLLAACCAAGAQSSSGYFFLAPGGVTSGGHTSATLHIGGGGDIQITRGAALGLELGAVAPRDRMRDAIGAFSPGGAYYFRRGRDLKLEPFAAGGYSLLFRSGYAHYAYAGGGVNYWMSRHFGLRLEFRDHIPATSDSIGHLWGFRFGLALR
jgi:hypothetical protein